MSNNGLKIEDGLLKELFKRGLHLGFSRARRHPSTEGHLFGYKNHQAIIDLEKTSESLARAKDFIKSSSGQGKKIILVGTKNEARLVVERAAERAGVPYVTERWLGGTLTNFKEFRRRVNRLLSIIEQEEKGELAVYTKKERGVIGKEKEKLERYFASLASLTELPGAVVVIDPKDEAIAVAEAKVVGVPVVALANSDCNIKGIDYPIVGNDTARDSIEYVVDELTAAYAEGKSLLAAKPATEEPVSDTPPAISPASPAGR
ncbi:MAG: 30S ribosomal protein S2 [Candidatus Vogelbacteria bacterium CG10_big_fil_rev_8_21_14_0_10_50_13]|uniref:Small ribosomal subunit protein uS2 n=1 Tax=Candidatus Vogelbacteria bacterium CG10_big_fil_rev_8_21_14_0_10_50_13 TaxID=1975044 RepID=A0A2H0RG14_9BACT|nr:MAG: 30S ribosomal protein S2 [Candidatus Vogelbacteria bacterium CG10_big_fil_rev_8_21_14_0_10_50_13]